MSFIVDFGVLRALLRLVAVGGLMALILWLVRVLPRHDQLVLTVLGFVVLAVPAVYLFIIIRRSRRLWQDRRAVIRFARLTANTVGIIEMQRAVDEQRTDGGLHMLLIEVRRRQLHSIPEVTAFLAFLSGVITRGGLVPESGCEPQWATWWAAYQARSDAPPLLQPSSEIVDEFGRLIEDAQRSTAFQI